MTQLTQENLAITFAKAKELDMKYIGLLIQMEGYHASEVIINKAENFDDKLAYYQKSYDEHLEHKFASGIRIVGFTYGNQFEDIEWDLYGAGDTNG